MKDATASYYEFSAGKPIYAFLVSFLIAIAGRIAEVLAGPFILSLATPLMIVVFFLTRRATA
ncbi:MAG: hypothetical protein ACOCZA_02015 [Spirochaetota bacterium]